MWQGWFVSWWSPRCGQGSLRGGPLRGAFFGLVAYATYDLTDLASLDRWPLLLTAVDLAWGSLLGALTTLAAVCAGLRIGSRDLRRGDGSIQPPQQFSDAHGLPGAAAPVAVALAGAVWRGAVRSP